MKPDFVSRVKYLFKSRSRTKNPSFTLANFLLVAVYVASGCLAAFSVRSSIYSCVQTRFNYLFQKISKLSISLLALYKPPYQLVDWSVCWSHIFWGGGKLKCNVRLTCFGARCAMPAWFTNFRPEM